MTEGRIVKGIGGFYYVKTEAGSIYECRAKGIFRKDKQKPLVGDYVSIDVISEEKKTGNVAAIFPRSNELIRPAVANVDQAVVIFSIIKPKPNLNLLDRFLIMMEKQRIETVICFNKQDISSEAEYMELKAAYGSCGYEVLFVSAKKQEGITKLREILKGKTTAVAGPSGVGKSSIINVLQPKAGMEIGSISEKIERGKHTTRHSELIYIEQNTYIVDTPGFSSLFIEEFDKDTLKEYYREFAQFEPYCRFQGCLHVDEPDCGIKNAVKEHQISGIRYENYKQLYGELKERKKTYPR